MTDLVERLRDAYAGAPAELKITTVLIDDLRDAADEIERLRTISAPQGVPRKVASMIRRLALQVDTLAERPCDVEPYFSFVLNIAADLRDAAITLDAAPPSAQSAEARDALIEELCAAIQPLCDIPFQQFDWRHRPDDAPFMGWNDHQLTVGDIKRAREALKRARENIPERSG